MKRSLLLFLVLSVLAVPSVSHALDLGLLGGPTLSTQTVNSGGQAILDNEGTDLSSGWGYGIGAFLSQNFFLFDLETDLLLAHRVLAYTFSDGSTGTESYNYLELPVLARFHVNPFLTLGGGLYYAHAVGSISFSSPNDDAATFGSGDSSYASQSESTSDFGLIFDVRGYWPIAPGVSGLIDWRYLFGLIDINTSPNQAYNTSWREMDLLLGLSFSLDP